MNQIFTYVSRQLAGTTIILTMVMSGVIWLFVSVKAVESIINRGLSLKLFFLLTSLQLPNFLAQIIPIAFFIAVLFVYGRLVSDREIVVLRAAGMSPLSLAAPVIVLGLMFTLIGYALSLYATPSSYQKFRQLQWDIRYNFTNVLLKEGVFNSVSKDLTVYIRERTGKSELRGILVHDNRNASKPATLIAQRGVMVQTLIGARVLMFEGNRQEVDRETGKLSILYFDRYSFDLGGISNKPNARFREPRERSVVDLLRIERKDVGNPKDYGKFVVEAHQRLALPANSLGFSLIAFLSIMLGEFSRRGNLLKVLTATGIFVLLQVTDLGLINVSARNFNLIPLIYLATFGPILISMFLLIYRPRLNFGSRKSHSAEQTAIN